MIPSVWAFVLLALAAYRTWRLLALDTVLDRPRGWVTRNETVSELVSCPWCLGAWITVVWWAVWWAWPHTTLIVAVPFALSAAVGFVATLVSALED